MKLIFLVVLLIIVGLYFVGKSANSLPAGYDKNEIIGKLASARDNSDECVISKKYPKSQNLRIGACRMHEVLTDYLNSIMAQDAQVRKFIQGQGYDYNKWQQNIEELKYL